MRRSRAISARCGRCWSRREKPRGPRRNTSKLSYLGRGYLNAKDFNAADQNAGEVRKLCLEQLAHRKLDADAALPLALGASIEIHAAVATAQGRRDEAVVFLREEAQRWQATSIRARIQKNLNLLTLEGKPAPPLEVTHAVTGRKLETLAQHRGHTVLLFFWAHWCSDCKNEIAVIARLQQQYGARGLQVIAPTQHYGYVAGGQEAAPAVETTYIKAVYRAVLCGSGERGGSAERGEFRPLRSQHNAHHRAARRCRNCQDVSSGESLV